MYLLKIMYVMNVTDYDNLTDDYNDTLSLNNNCTINERKIEIILPTIFLTVPCGRSFLCSMSSMV